MVSSRGSLICLRLEAPSRSGINRIATWYGAWLLRHVALGLIGRPASIDACARSSPRLEVHRRRWRWAGARCGRSGR
jgi:hypothetical protein